MNIGELLAAPRPQDGSQLPAALRSLVDQFSREMMLMKRRGRGETAAPPPMTKTRTTSDWH